MRGCIGTLAASEPIPQAIANAAISAGARDPRFEPVSLRELSECDIEISILGPLTRVRSMDEIVAGRHGLVVEKDGRRGLLLPQVAQKYGWTAREFLRQTYAKAGLAPSEEIGSASVQAFEAIVFGELDDIR
ncbi:MAG: hypothetical protein BWZ10_01348 [candidate division BRC1 bacterium ADurb.BinA364]|nr:MAG: hypothetical protein BWZ10_01348 [candidate division BRC1 bacterium ADurb.BinA364]